MVLLQDYLESVAERVRAVPGAVKTSLIAWSEALGLPWPHDNPLACAAAQVESSEIPKHAQPMKLDTIETPESMALNVEIDPLKRAFAFGILLMAYASLRFSDVQRLRILEVGEDSAHGKPHSRKLRNLMAFRDLGRAHAWVSLVRQNGPTL